MQERLSKNTKITLSILFCFIGLILLSFTYFDTIKREVFNRKNIELLEQQIVLNDVPDYVEVGQEVPEQPEKPDTPVVSNQDTYIGYLEVPVISLKRGFLSLDSKYNSIKYNVQLIKGSTMPNVENSNLILAAHRGNSSISYFHNLYKLELGNEAIIHYNNIKYTYKLVDMYLEDKDGTVAIKRNGHVKGLTLITCTKEDSTKQSIYIFELVSEEGE